MKEMVGGCCVCSDERGWPENPLVYCDGQNCTVAVHQACYGIVTVPTGPWYCRKCESQERTTRVRCELCPSRDGALKKTDNQQWAHVVCALYIPEVRFGNVTTMEPIILQLIPPERYGKTCYICHEMGKGSRATVGACMQCNKSNCKQQFHVTCAQSLGLLCEEAGNYLDNVKYCGYCQYHYSKLKKGGNVKTIPPYKPISRDSSSDSASSPEKECDAIPNGSNSNTSSNISIKINSNLSTSLQQSTSASSSKQRKSYNISKQPLLCPTSNSNTNTSGSSNMHNSLHSFNTSNSLPSSLSSTSSVPNIGTSSSNTNFGFGSNSSTVLTGSANNLSSNISNTKISSSNLTSYKDKESKHGKNFSKTSTSNKDKEVSYTFSTFRDKCSKTSKNKDSNINSSTNNNNSNNNNPGVTTAQASNIIGSSTHVSAHSSNVTQTLTSSHSNPSNYGTQTTICGNGASSNAINLNTSNTTSTSLKTSSTTSTSLNHTSTGFTVHSQEESTNLNSTTSLVENTIASQSKTNTSTSSTLSPSSSIYMGKKRKTDVRNVTTQDEANGQFRDIIKDVSVSLTQLTDFEKEIERSSKKQKTEFSPPTHQTSITETNLDSSREATIISTSVTLSTTTTNSNNKQNNQEIRISPGPIITTTTTSTTSTTSTLSSNQKINNSTTSTAAASSSSSSSSLTLSNSREREDRYATSQSAIAVTQNSTNSNGIVTSSAISNNGGSVSSSIINTSKSNTNSAPSLYVSVPLSNANVPGINIPTNSASTTTAEHPSSISTRSATSQQQHQQQQLNNVTNNKTHIGIPCDNSTTSIANTTFSTSLSNTNIMQSPSHHGVIYQSGKSPITTNVNTNINTNVNMNNITTLATAGSNLTATTTESGNLKITYDKQSSTTRSNQTQQQQNSIPLRRSRTPDTSSIQSLFNVSMTNTMDTMSVNSLAESGDGLKFSYEPQVGSNSMPATFESPPVKESPPSSPGSEAGSLRKRGKKSKEASNSSASSQHLNLQQQQLIQTSIGGDMKDVKIFQNCNQANTNITTTTTISTNKGTGPSSALNITSATHMLGNQINPNSSVAQKLSDQLIMEIQDHSAYTSDAITPQFVGVPFPGKLRNATTPLGTGSNIGLQAQSTQPGSSPLVSMFGSGTNGSMSLLQSLEQLLERQWEQGSQFLMEQAQHFDIASLLSCLHQLQTENVRLEEHVTNLIARRDHLLAVNARLAIPLNATNTNQSQASNSNVSSGGSGAATTNAQNLSTVTTTGTATSITTSNISTSNNLTATAMAAAASLASAATTSISQTVSNGAKTLPNTASVISVGVGVNNVTNSNIGRPISNLDNCIDFRKSSTTTTLSNVRHNKSEAIIQH